MKNVIVVGGNSMADLRNGIDAALAAMEKGGMMYCVGASSAAELETAKAVLETMGGITAPKGCGCNCPCCNCEDEDEIYTDEDVDDAYENGYEDGYADTMNEMADADEEPPKSAEDEMTEKAKAYLEMLCDVFGIDPSKYGM